jgi:urease accessory protein
LKTAQRILLFGTARGVLSAAVRLGIAGSFEAQRMQADCEGCLDAVAARCANLAADDLTQTAPLIDLLQSRHDRLYSRLFQS